MNAGEMWIIVLFVLGAQLLGTLAACSFCDDPEPWGRDSRHFMSQLFFMSIVFIGLAVFFIIVRDDPAECPDGNFYQDIGCWWGNLPWAPIGVMGIGILGIIWIIYRIVVAPTFFTKN